MMKDWHWRTYLKNLADDRDALIVLRLLDDLTDRRGLRHAFEEIDSDIQKEIIDRWIEIINDYGS